MAKIRSYDPDTGRYSNDAPKDKRLASFTDSGTVTIRKSWLYPEYPVSPKEKEILSDCRRLLKERRIMFLRTEGGGVMHHAGDGTVKLAGSSMRGWPDLLIVTRPLGTILGVEVKRPGGAVEISQLAILSDILRCGGRAAICCSAIGLEAILLGSKPLHLIQHPGLRPIGVY